ncbi:STAS domain-containing protein, partial [candidate division KSB1 bacterium]|nr:STAS domain-containing protein [candidate division KSB1 bacterium]
MRIAISENSLTLEGNLDLHAAGEHHKTLRDWLVKKRDQDIYLDLSGVNSIDSAGVALVDELQSQAQRAGAVLHLVDV